MRYLKPTLMLVTATILALGSANAQDNPPREPRQMSSEERDAAREARRAKWDNMSEEERAAAREQRRQRNHEHRKAMRERFKNMSDEEREAARERRREHKGQHQQGDRKRHAHGDQHRNREDQDLQGDQGEP